MKYAEVAVNYPLPQPRTFSYTIPPHMSLSPGHAVWVPFGPRQVQGIVLAISDFPSVEETKPVADAIDSQPILAPHQVELCRWMAEFEPVVAAGYDSGASLTAPQHKLLSTLRGSGRTSLKDLRKSSAVPRIEAVVEQLARKKLILKSHEVERLKVRPRIETRLHLSTSKDHAQATAAALQEKRATKQAKLLELKS
jgi:primosomal protein N'